MTIQKSDQRSRILLVVGDADHARKIGHMLAQADDPAFEVHTASTLAQVTVALSSESFDGLLLNLSLPDSQGLATLEVILAASRVPIIILADTRAHIYIDELVQRGVQGYLPMEGLEAQTLTGALLIALERGRAEQRMRQGHAKYHAIIEELEDAYFEVATRKS